MLLKFSFSLLGLQIYVPDILIYFFFYKNDKVEHFFFLQINTVLTCGHLHLLLGLGFLESFYYLSLKVLF